MWHLSLAVFQLAMASLPLLKMFPMVSAIERFHSTTPCSQTYRVSYCTVFSGCGYDTDSIQWVRLRHRQYSVGAATTPTVLVSENMYHSFAVQGTEWLLPWLPPTQEGVLSESCVALLMIHCAVPMLSLRMGTR